jgi:exonuclease III
MYGTEGDFPIAALRGIKTWPKAPLTIHSENVPVVKDKADEHDASVLDAVPEKPEPDIEPDLREQLVTFYAKNVQSLQTETRLTELFAEVDLLTKWDFILLTETWRGAVEEQFQNGSGHLFFGSGGSLGSSGVAILAHQRWERSVTAFRPISSRVCYLDLTIYQVAVRLVSAYLPHAWHDDGEVEEIYDILSALRQEAARDRRLSIFMGDWNAALGAHPLPAERFNIGDHGLGVRNLRGDLFANWVVSEKLLVANTMFDKHVAQKWTHQGTYGQRQIDYACIDEAALWRLRDAEGSDDLGIGSDHRAVKMQLRFLSHRTSCKRSLRSRASAWRPVDVKKYKDELQGVFGSFEFEGSPFDATKIEEGLASIAQKCQHTEKSQSRWRLNLSDKAKALIQERKTAKHGTGRPLRVICKELQKELRSCARRQQTTAIENILANFRGLANLPWIRAHGRKMRLTSVKDTNGIEQHCRRL